MARIERVLNYEAAIQAASEGRSNRQIALAMGCETYVLYHELKRNPAFANQVKEARAFGLSLHADKLLNLHEHYPDADPPMLRIISDNIKFVAIHLCPDFRPTSVIEVKHANVKDALQEAKSRVIDITPKPKQITNPLD